MTRYTVTRTAQGAWLLIEWGIKKPVVDYMVQGFKDQGAPITPLDNYSQTTGADLCMCVGGMIWVGGPQNRLIEGIVQLEVGSLDAIREALHRKLSRDNHPEWVGLWTWPAHFFAFKRKTAERLLEALSSKEVVAWDAEYQEGWLSAREEANKHPYVHLVGPQPLLPGEH